MKSIKEMKFGKDILFLTPIPYRLTLSNDLVETWNAKKHAGYGIEMARFRVVPPHLKVI